MEGLKYQLFRGVLNSLYFSGAYAALKPLTGGVGAVLMLHHVRLGRPDQFQPNHLLEVTPKFFERVIRRLRRSRIDLISLDEMHRRLSTGDFPRRRFVCVTFDDGYRDNLQFAYPILKKRGDLLPTRLRGVDCVFAAIPALPEARKEGEPCSGGQQLRNPLG